jgi:hypothetical protein
MIRLNSSVPSRLLSEKLYSELEACSYYLTGWRPYHREDKYSLQWESETYDSDFDCDVAERAEEECYWLCPPELDYAPALAVHPHPWQRHCTRPRHRRTAVADVGYTRTGRKTARSQHEFKAQKQDGALKGKGMATSKPHRHWQRKALRDIKQGLHAAAD